MRPEGIDAISHFHNPACHLPAVVRLEPMSEGDFQESLDRAIPRHAAEQVRQGLWTKEDAVEASRLEFDQLLPLGRETADYHFCQVVDEGTGSRIGETWYVVRSRGGKTQFWVDWIWIEPQFRRRGAATQVFRQLEEEARKLGADRVGLHVRNDNDAAKAPYTKLGYRTTNLRMVKLLSPLL